MEPLNSKSPKDTLLVIKKLGHIQIDTISELQMAQYLVDKACKSLGLFSKKDVIYLKKQFISRVDNILK